MRDTVRWIRIRSLLANYLVPVVLLALVVAAAGGYLTMSAYGETDTRMETQQVATWESSGTFTHNATVVNGTDVYAEGDRLENRRVYFRELTPTLNGSFAYAYTASDGGNLTTDAQTTLVFRSVGESASGNATEYWRFESDLGSRQATLSPGDRLVVPFSVNVSAATQRLDSIDSQFGGTPGEKQLYVETELTLSGTRNGQPVDQTRTYQLPITPSGSVYEVGATNPTMDSGSRTEQVPVSTDPGMMQSYGGPFLLLLGLVTAACCLGGRYAGLTAVSEAEREWLAYRDARNEFDDWISSARVPETETPDSTVEVESLEDLVDIAIDTDGRVLEDRDRDAFFVFGEHRTYVYSPPSKSPSSALSSGGQPEVKDAPGDTEQTLGLNPFTSNEESSPESTDGESAHANGEHATDQSE